VIIPTQTTCMKPIAIYEKVLVIVMKSLSRGPNRLMKILIAAIQVNLCQFLLKLGWGNKNSPVLSSSSSTCHYSHTLGCHLGFHFILQWGHTFYTARLFLCRYSIYLCIRVSLDLSEHKHTLTWLKCGLGISAVSTLPWWFYNIYAIYQIFYPCTKESCIASCW